MNENPKGVSAIICTHNKSSNLYETLKHIAVQRISPDIQWEVIVVDNASTDNTQSLARSIWIDNGNPTELRILSESRLGVAYARRTGMTEAKYAYMCFIDDDNWLNENFIQTVFEIFETKPDVGVCGGPNSPAFEATPPWWFEEYKGIFAVGEQHKTYGYVDESGVFWGAGMGIRKKAWNELNEKGFEPLLRSRTGKGLLSGEDDEICFILRLNGWELWYDPRLHLKHFQSAARLQWDYVKRWHRGFGESKILIEFYRKVVYSQGSIQITSSEKWYRQAIKTLYELIRNIHCFRHLIAEPREGESVAAWQTVWIEMNLGKLFALLRKRGAYERAFEKIKDYANN